MENVLMTLCQGQEGRERLSQGLVAKLEAPGQLPGREAERCPPRCFQQKVLDFRSVASTRPAPERLVRYVEGELLHDLYPDRPRACGPSQRVRPSPL